MQNIGISGHGFDLTFLISDAGQFRRVWVETKNPKKVDIYEIPKAFFDRIDFEAKQAPESAKKFFIGACAFVHFLIATEAENERGGIFETPAVKTKTDLSKFRL